MIQDASSIEPGSSFSTVRETHATARKNVPGGVHLRGLSRRFGERVVLDALDLDIAPGEFVAMLGRSGSGKTTLLRTLAGLDALDSGRLDAPARTSVVFQESRLMPWKRVWKNVVMGVSGPRGRDKAMRALGAVGLQRHADAWPHTLSGGEAQRVALARSLIREPELLLLDEPFSALDALTRAAMHRLVIDLWAQTRPAVLLVTHDIDEAILLADRIVVLDAGRISFSTRVDATRPREPGDSAHRTLRRHLLQLLSPEAVADTGAGQPIHAA
jgi:sulfonate transport system ATP-binding protein